MGFPGGLNFRSLEVHRCKNLGGIPAMCGRVTTSTSYLWSRTNPQCESNPSIHVYAVI